MDHKLVKVKWTIDYREAKELKAANNQHNMILRNLDQQDILRVLQHP